MKNIINVAVVISLTLFVYGCSSAEQQPKLEKNEFESIDTILRRSEENFNSVNRANDKTDSSISEKVEKTVKQINTLKEVVKQLKEENDELKIKISDTSNNGKPFQLLPVSSSKNDR